MRLSDAIALGRTLGLDLCRYGKRAGEHSNRGCALDMAVLAVDGGKDWHDASYIWPWLNNKVLEKDKTSIADLYLFEIASRFDCDVMTGTITLDRLIDWVRSVEPAEEIFVDEAPVEEVEYASMT
jgi:hypothetical protein